MKTKLFFAAGATSFMIAGAAAGAYATFLAIHVSTDGESTRMVARRTVEGVVNKGRKVVFRIVEGKKN